VFNAVVASHHGLGNDVGRFLITVGVGGAAIGVAVLWLCLVRLELGTQLATSPSSRASWASGRL
jgi:hypothetical protein